MQFCFKKLGSVFAYWITNEQSNWNSTLKSDSNKGTGESKATTITMISSADKDVHPPLIAGSPAWNNMEDAGSREEGFQARTQLNKDVWNKMLFFEITEKFTK